ncbi:hypothetical protein Pcinc_000987 [Petrolisthes cinctipes]|uniref:Nuclear pore complex protein Nup153 n=1 Tax=Petrolisthes cinctipes TaxID=88211 RepID=A0AAE1L3J7_PETCI|nr:hypothetical protein Pcinc_000987 [Petrolisthes cinctipes]
MIWTGIIRRVTDSVTGLFSASWLTGWMGGEEEEEGGGGGGGGSSQEQPPLPPAPPTTLPPPGESFIFAQPVTARRSFKPFYPEEGETESGRHMGTVNEGASTSRTNNASPTLQLMGESGGGGGSSAAVSGRRHPVLSSTPNTIFTGRTKGQLEPRPLPLLTTSTPTTGDDGSSDVSESSVDTGVDASVIPRPDERDYQREILQLDEESLQTLRDTLAKSVPAPPLSLSLPLPPITTTATSTTINATHTAILPTIEETRKRPRDLEQDQSSIRAEGSVSSKSLFSDVGDVSHSQPQPSGLASKRPRFNVSMYGSPILDEKSVLSDSFKASPFYPGKTMYGGASAYRRSRIQTRTPIQTTRTQVKAKNVDENSEDGGLSQAARRILESLEQMSTPISDAKRIPTPTAGQRGSFLDHLPGSYRVSAYHHRQQQQQQHRRTSSSLQQSTPPVTPLLTPTKVGVQANFATSLLTNTSNNNNNNNQPLPHNNKKTTTVDIRGGGGGETEEEEEEAEEMEDTMKGNNGGGGGTISILRNTNTNTNTGLGTTNTNMGLGTINTNNMGLGTTNTNNMGLGTINTNMGLGTINNNNNNTGLGTTNTNVGLGSTLSFPSLPPTPNVGGGVVVDAPTFRFGVGATNTNNTPSPQHTPLIPFVPKPTTPSDVTCKKFSGKVKSKVVDSGRSSLRTSGIGGDDDHDVSEHPKLPSVTLTMPSLPKINLSLSMPPTTTATMLKCLGNSNNSSNSNDSSSLPGFKFSIPEIVNTDAIGDSLPSTPQFTFRSPAVVGEATGVTTGIGGVTGTGIGGVTGTGVTPPSSRHSVMFNSSSPSLTPKLKANVNRVPPPSDNKVMVEGSVLDILKPKGINKSQQKFPLSTTTTTSTSTLSNNHQDGLKMMTNKPFTPLTKSPNIVGVGAFNKSISEQSVNNLVNLVKETDKSQQGFSSTFTKSINEWDCSVCLVRNKNNVDKCVACETIKPVSNSSGNSSTSTTKLGEEKKMNAAPPVFVTSSSNSTSINSSNVGWGDAFKKHTSEWECGTCMVRNKDTSEKCVACQTNKPTTTTSSSSSNNNNNNNTRMESGGIVSGMSEVGSKEDKSGGVGSGGFGSVFAKKKGEWECDTCFVRNQCEFNKCVSCETPKPGAANMSEAMTGNFKFGVNTNTTSSSSFKFGLTSNTQTDLKIAGAGAGGGGVSVVGSSSSSSSSSGGSSNSSGFSFSVSANNNNNGGSSGGGGGCEDKKGLSGFKFGVPMSDKKSDASRGFNTNKRPDSTSEMSTPSTTFKVKTNTDMTTTTTNTATGIGGGGGGGTGAFIFGDKASTFSFSTPAINKGEAKSNFSFNVNSNKRDSSESLEPAKKVAMFGSGPTTGGINNGVANAPPLFTFGSKENKLGTGTGFGSPVTSTPPLLAFGSPAPSSNTTTTATATTTTTFQFGNSNPPVPAATAFGNPTPAFGGGVGSGVASAFGNNNTTTTSAVTVTAAAAAAAAAAASGFAFGQSSEKKSSAGFDFGQAATNTTTPTQGFNFTAATQPTQPIFQFGQSQVNSGAPTNIFQFGSTGSEVATPTNATTAFG